MSYAPKTKQSVRMKWLRHAIERRSASVAGLLLVIVMGLIGWVQTTPNAPVIGVILLVVVYEFQKRLDQGVPLLQLTGLIAVLQWLVGPIINYSSAYKFGRYSMYIPEEEYFRFALPATAFYVAIMLTAGASVRQNNLLQLTDRRRFFTVGVVLNVIGAGAASIAGPGGGGLAFLLHLISQLRYVGAIYFLFSRNQLRLLFAAASCLQLVGHSLGQGMFHDLILWLAILFCYWFAQRRWSVGVKFLFLTLGLVSLFSIQVVKQEYRSLIQKHQNPSLVRLIVDYVTPGGRAWETDTLKLTITRLNQGWIISAVMKHVPDQEPYAGGETVKTAVVGALVPRFLWKDKAKAGGRENFRRFTGLEIGDTTSMGISPLGEAYANFGRIGGIVFMLSFGGLFALAYYSTLKYAVRYPTFLFWIPLIYYQAVKAETELLVIVNQLVKGGIIAFAGHFIIMRTFHPKVRMTPAASTSPQASS